VAKPEEVRVSSIQVETFTSNSSVKAMARRTPGKEKRSPLTSFDDPCAPKKANGVVVHSVESERRLLISDLGWSSEKAEEAYMRLRHFEEGWDAPGMDAYDDL
jgi:hypothetical protein